MAQCTSKGTRCFIPNNRDPRYFHPTYTFHDTSTDSITQTTPTTLTHANSCDISLRNLTNQVCDICNKVLPTKKGLKLHKIRYLKRRDTTPFSQINSLSVNNTVLCESTSKEEGNSNLSIPTLDL